MRDALDRYFGITAHGSSFATEIRGGLTTFFVMAYILVLNPVILSSATHGRGPDFAATVTTTALCAGVLTLAMGIYARYPLAMASGMGLNAVVAFDLVLGRGLTWQQAMGVVFLEGALITVLVLTGFREAVMNAVPVNLKRAIGAGIGCFLLLIGLVDAGLVRVPIESAPLVDGRIAGQPAPPLALGNLVGWPIVLAVLGLLLTLALQARRVKGALLAGILGTTALGLAAHHAFGADVSAAPGLQGALPTTLASPSFATLGAGADLGVFGALPLLSAALVVFSLMLSDFFDTMGTVVAIGTEAGWLDAKGRLPRTERVLLVDSLGAVLGGLASASSVTTYIESGAGVADGARTGLASVVTGLAFLACILLAPFVGVVPTEAAAPALIIVGCTMAMGLRQVGLDDPVEGIPALLTITLMPFTYSITNGIGAGFVSFAFLKLVTGRGREVHWMMWLVSAAFLLYFLLHWIATLGASTQ